MEYFCTFCCKADANYALIELSSNLLFIDKSHYDFPRVFEELFNITSDDLKSNFICEACKDSVVQFFIFRKGVVGQMNRNRRMILSQIDDFLKQNKPIEEIQVIRKLHSITLQVDNVAAAPTIEECEIGDDVLEDDLNYEEVMSEQEEGDETIEEIQPLSPSIEDEQTALIEGEVVEVLSCSKCEEMVTSREELEFHEFLKHSVIGVYIERKVECDSDSKVIKNCQSCSQNSKDRSSQISHVLLRHRQEIIDCVNDMLSVKSLSVDHDAINAYIDFIENISQLNSIGQEGPIIDENIKQYFYELYSYEAVTNDAIIEAVETDEGIQESTTDVFPQRSNYKTGRSMTGVSDENREWIRKELALRKKMIQNSNGQMRPIYRCAYCNQHTSNSAPGFRYHLLNKHLNSHDIDSLQELDHPHFEAETSQRNKNICSECCLKFKSLALFQAHQACHDLLSVVSEYYLFPSCNTCSALFIDEATLNLHLGNHDNQSDVLQPVPVPPGKIVLLGKVYKAQEVGTNQPEGFAWSCGHCEMKFDKKNSCRFHLLMFHAQSFECPVDKRNFSGFKSVSLFCHHLRNKHSEYFPELSFPCTFCKVEFPSVYEKLSHMKSCSLKKFSCDHCGKKFFKKSELISHLKFVSGEITFPCKVCNKKCETLSDLKIHLRSHTKEKPFDCPMCGKSFRTLATRSNHVDSHNTNVVYKCMCGKTFKQRQMYRRHMKATHENNQSNVRLGKQTTQSAFAELE